MRSCSPRRPRPPRSTAPRRSICSRLPDLCQRYVASLRWLLRTNQPTSQPIDQHLSHRSQFRHDPAAGSFISLSEFLEFRKEIFTKLREVEDEVIALKYQLKKK